MTPHHTKLLILRLKILITDFSALVIRGAFNSQSNFLLYFELQGVKTVI